MKLIFYWCTLPASPRLIHIRLNMHEIKSIASLTLWSSYLRYIIRCKWENILFNISSDCTRIIVLWISQWRMCLCVWKKIELEWRWFVWHDIDFILTFSFMCSILHSSPINNAKCQFNFKHEHWATEIPDVQCATEDTMPMLIELIWNFRNLWNSYLNVKFFSAFALVATRFRVPTSSTTSSILILSFSGRRQSQSFVVQINMNGWDGMACGCSYI